MKKNLALLFLLFAFLNVSAIDVVKLPLPSSNKMVVKFMFHNGSISDGPDKKGITRLTSSLIMDGGTGKLTSTQIKDMAYPWAADWYATVDKEVVVFTFEFHKDHVREFSPIMLRLISEPSLSEDDFDRAKSNQLNYVNQVIKASSDEEFSKMGLEDLLFRETNYQHMVNGTSNSIESISLEDVKEHYRKFFTQSNLTVGIAGNFNQEFVDRILKGVSRLSSEKPEIPEAGKANSPEGIYVEIISKENALGSAIFTGAPLPITRKDKDFAALMVANSWLGEHRKSYSRLYKKIREERSMNYGDYTYIEWYSNGGSNMLPPPGYPRSSNYFAIWLRPVQTAEGLKKQYSELENISVGHAHYALRMAVREITRLKEAGMSQEDFELTRDFLRAYTKLYIQTPERHLGYLMDSKFYGRTDFINEIDKELADLTVEQVNDAINSYLDPQSMYVCIVTDDSEAGPLKNSLLNNTPSPMSYSDALKASLPESILNEDEEVSKIHLDVKSVNVVTDKSMFMD